jgi:hypothetical protein
MMRSVSGGGRDKRGERGSGPGVGGGDGRRSAPGAGGGAGTPKGWGPGRFREGSAPGGGRRERSAPGARRRFQRGPCSASSLDLPGTPPPRNRPRLEESPHALLRQEKQAQPSLSHSGPVTLPEPSSSVAVHLWSWGETKAEEATRTHLQHKNAHVGLFRTLRVRGLDTRMRFPRRHWTQGAGPR